MVGLTLLLTSSDYVQPAGVGCGNGGSDDASILAIYSPPSSIIRVSTSDAQIYSFQYPPGVEHYRLGCYCNGWGIGYGSGSYYRYTHYDNSLYGLTLESSTTVSWGPVYRWRVVYRTTDGRFRIIHQFAYCPGSGGLRVRATIRNISGTTQYGVKFKRYIDWDMNPGYFSSNYFYRTSTMCYAIANSWNRYAALAAIGPTPSVIELYGWDHYSTYTSSSDYSSYTGDGYCILDWYIGTMYPGDSFHIDACYAAGSDYSSLTAHVSSCAACPLEAGTEGDELAVEEKAEVREVSITVRGREILISGYSGEVRVYATDGDLVTLKRIAGKGSLRVPTSGAYIVKAGGYAKAVVVR